MARVIGLIGAALLVAGTASAGETIEAAGHTWKVRDTDLDWDKDVGDSADTLGALVEVSATDARQLLGWPDGAIGAAVTRGSWGIVTDRSVYFAESGLEEVWQNYVAAIARTEGYDAVSTLEASPAEQRARVDVVIHEFWLSPGDGPLHPSVTTLKVDLRLFAPGTDEPEWVLTVDRPTATAPRFGKSSWEQAMEAAVPMIAEALGSARARDALNRPPPPPKPRPAPEPTAEPTAETPPDGYQVAWLRLIDGSEVVGTVLRVAADGVCLATASGEKLVPRTDVADDETFDLPRGGGIGIGSEFGVATLPSGDRIAGAVVAKDPWTLALPNDLRGFRDGSSIQTGPIRFEPTPGGLCAAYGE